MNAPRQSVMNTQGRRLDTLKAQVQDDLLKARYRIQHGRVAKSIAIFTELWHQMVKPGASMRPSAEQEASIEQRYDELLQRDIENTEQGYYPRELLLQLPIAHYARLLPVALMEAPKVLFRIYRNRYDDLPQDLDLSTFPSYYRRNFHWQTDGWFSEHSARLYDVSVEVLFAGTADIMRRMTIPPVVEAVQGLHQPRILDVACGTGRFLLQLSQALPMAKYYAMDLSPFYLKYAEKLLRNVPDVSFLSENGEEMSLADEVFDVVTTIYLFHELPKDARRRVAKEMFRVLKPGGTLVVCGSAQRSESSEIIGYLERFPTLYHEPYYKGYLNDTLEDFLAEVGFEIQSVEPHLVSKVVVARKP